MTTSISPHPLLICWYPSQEMCPPGGASDEEEEEEPVVLEADGEGVQLNWDLAVERGSPRNDDDDVIDADMWASSDATPLAPVQMRNKRKSTAGNKMKLVSVGRKCVPSHQ